MTPRFYALNGWASSLVIGAITALFFVALAMLGDAHAQLNDANHRIGVVEGHARECISIARQLRDMHTECVERHIAAKTKLAVLEKECGVAW